MYSKYHLINKNKSDKTHFYNGVFGPTKKEKSNSMTFQVVN